MPKNTHKRAKFSKEEMALDVPSNLNLGRMIDLGRGSAAIRLAMELSRLRRGTVRLEPDVAAVFKDSDSVNRALRGVLDALRAIGPAKRRKSA